MRKITLAVDNPQININGKVFDIQKSDLEIYAMGVEIAAKFENYDISKHTPAEILTALQEITGVIEQILGEGATRKISGGKPVSMKRAMGWIADIAENAAATYSEDIGDE